MILKQFLYEFKRIIYNYKNISIVGFYLLIVLVLALLATNKQTGNYEKPNNEEQLKENYIERDKAKLIYDYLVGNIDELPNGMIISIYPGVEEEIYKRYLYYDFLVKTETTFSDYVHLGKSSISHKDNKYSVYMIYLSTLIYYWLIFVAIGLGLNINCKDFDDGQIKNIIAAPISRKSVYLGKILFFIIALAFAFFFVYIAGLYYGMKTPNVHVLLYEKDKYISQSAILYFNSKMILMYFTTLFIGILSVLLANATDNILKGAAAAIAICVFIFGLYIIIANNVRHENIAIYFPLINPTAILSSFGSIVNIFLNISYIVGTSILIIFGYKVMKRREI